MPAKPIPFYNHILFRILLPVVVVGIVVATALVSYLSAPIKRFLSSEFDASLRLAATMGLRTCEESLDYLLELRFEQNQEMNQVMQAEVIEKIRAIGDSFPHVHLLVVQAGSTVIACHSGDAPRRWTGPPLAGKNDSSMTFVLQGDPVRSHVQFFPFWDWHIVSFVSQEDFQAPLRMAYGATYLSTVGVFLALLATLLAVFHLFIRRPLDQLVSATDGVAEGRLTKIEKIARTEFGRLMVSHNAMVTRLDEEKAAVRNLIHQLTSIYSSLPVIVWSLDREGRFTLSEGKELETLGLKAGQVVGQSVFDVYRDNPDIIANVKKALAGQASEYESEVLGNAYLTVINPALDEDGRVQWVSGLAINVSERRRAEDEVRQLRNFLSNIIDSMPSVLIGVDAEDRITQWNSEARRVTGMPAEAALGRPLIEVYPRLADEMPSIREAIRTRQVRSAARKARMEDRQARYEAVTIYPLMTGAAAGAVIRVDDVTEQVRLEEMMIQSEKMLSVGGLAAGMAHEINNPLAGILQNTAVLINRLSGDLPANHEAAAAAGTSMAAIGEYLRLRKLTEMLDNIQTSGSMAADIVKNMLSFARKSEGVVSSHDLGLLLDQTADLLKTDFDMKRHYDFKQMVIERHYEDPPVPVPCEASKLRQVFMNILKNGAEAMATATEDPAAPAFVLRVKSDGPWMRVEIEDNGPGIDAGTRRRIFEPFFTTKSTGEGTGLGLSVSYFIVAEDHGGEMWVQPVETGGSCFVIRLPIKGKRAEPT